MAPQSRSMWIDNVFARAATVLVEPIQKQFRHVPGARVEVSVQSCVRWVQACTLRALVLVINVKDKVK